MVWCFEFLFLFNPIALRKAKIVYTILAFLSAIELTCNQVFSPPKPFSNKEGIYSQTRAHLQLSLLWSLWKRLQSSVFLSSSHHLGQHYTVTEMNQGQVFKANQSFTRHWHTNTPINHLQDLGISRLWSIFCKILAYLDSDQSFSNWEWLHVMHNHGMFSLLEDKNKI